MKYVLAIAILALALGSSGCMGVLARTGIDSGAVPEDPGFFAGTRSNCWLIGQTVGGTCDGSMAMMPFVLVDLPLSAAVDVICIPYDLGTKIKNSR